MSWRQTVATDLSASSPSRAINLASDEAAVRTACGKHKLGISAVEPLQSGGVRVIMLNLADADRIRSLFRRQMIDGAVDRAPWVGVS